MTFYATYENNGRIVGMQTHMPDGALPFIEIENLMDSGITHYVENDTLVPIPMRPSDKHTFDYTTKQWVDPRTLGELKSAKWEEVKAIREAAIDAPLVTPYGTADSKAKDRTNITDAILMLQTLTSIGTPTTIDFTMADNVTVTLTTTEMVTIGLLLGQKVQAAHSRARELRLSIENAITASELTALTW